VNARRRGKSPAPDRPRRCTPTLRFGASRENQRPARKKNLENPAGTLIAFNLLTPSAAES